MLERGEEEEALAAEVVAVVMVVAVVVDPRGRQQSRACGFCLQLLLDLQELLLSLRRLRVPLPTVQAVLPLLGLSRSSQSIHY